MAPAITNASACNCRMKWPHYYSKSAKRRILCGISKWKMPNGAPLHKVNVQDIYDLYNGCMMLRKSLMIPYA